MARLIIDANNHFRRELETYRDGSAPRGVLNKWLHNEDEVVIVWDGPNALKRRRAIYPAYKERRQKAGEDIYVGFDVIREVLKHCPVVQIRCAGWEADDVIATIAKPGDTIWSTDLDLRQIEGVHFRDQVREPCAREHLRTFKTLVGDSSDNIPGAKGFGEGAWKREPPERWTEWLRTEGGIDVDLPTRVQVDWEELRKYWQIVGLFDVPMEEIAEGLTVGVKDFVAADAYLRKWMQ